MDFKAIALSVWAWAKARAVEKSTWVGIVGAVASGAGYALSPDNATMVSGIIATVMGAVLVGSKTKDAPVDPAAK